MLWSLLIRFCLSLLVLNLRAKEPLRSFGFQINRSKRGEIILYKKQSIFFLASSFCNFCHHISRILFNPRLHGPWFLLSCPKNIISFMSIQLYLAPVTGIESWNRVKLTFLKSSDIENRIWHLWVSIYSKCWVPRGQMILLLKRT